MLAGFQAKLYSATFLIQLRTTYLGVVPPTVGCVLLYQLTVKTLDMPTGQSVLGNSSVEVLLSDDFRLSKPG